MRNTSAAYIAEQYERPGAKGDARPPVFAGDPPSSGTDNLKERPTMLAGLEAKIKLFWRDLSGDARAELEKALAGAKADEARLKPLIGTFKTDLEGIVAAAEPELKQAAGELVAKLAADAAAILG